MAKDRSCFPVLSRITLRGLRQIETTLYLDVFPRISTLCLSPAHMVRVPFSNIIMYTNQQEKDNHRKPDKGL